LVICHELLVPQVEGCSWNPRFSTDVLGHFVSPTRKLLLEDPINILLFVWPMRGAKFPMFARRGPWGDTILIRGDPNRPPATVAATLPHVLIWGDPTLNSSTEFSSNLIVPVSKSCKQPLPISLRKFTWPIGSRILSSCQPSPERLNFFLNVKSHWWRETGIGWLCAMSVSSSGENYLVKVGCTFPIPMLYRIVAEWLLVSDFSQLIEVNVLDFPVSSVVCV
jgi:hypothetical protein